MTRHARAFVVASLLALTATPVWAAGNITGVSVNKASILFGESLLADVAGTIMKDFFGRGCTVRVSLQYSNNSVEIVHPSFMVGSFPSTGFYLKPSHAGTVKVIASGGDLSFLGWPPCTGTAQKSIKVLIKVVPIRAGKR